MELRHLRYFQAVADSGHMTRAAAELGIQQPPLSQQIRALETELGLALFKRHPKGVALTDAGRLLLVDARRILLDVEAMRQRMAAVAGGLQGMLAVGFTSSAAAHPFTPEALRACRGQYPDIALVIGENNAAEITESIASSRLDCGLLRVPVARPPGLVFEPLLREAVVVALPLDHPLARPAANGRPRTLRLQDLRDEGLTLCEKRGFRPRVVAEVDRMMTNLNLVAAGAGISVVPTSMQGTHPHAIAYRALAAASALDAPLTLVHRAQDNPGPATTFIALLRKLAARWHRP